MEYRIHIYDINSKKYFVERECVELTHPPQVIAKHARYYTLAHYKGTDLFYDAYYIYDIGLNQSYHDRSNA